jgi:hypothetical protein
VSPKYVVVCCLLPLALACDSIFGPEPLLRTNIASISAPDTVAASTVFTVSVHVTHGPCQRPLTPRVSYVSDTVFFDARVKHDERVFDGICDADILLGQIFDVAVGPRPQGTLVLLPRAQAVAASTDTVVIVDP